MSKRPNCPRCGEQMKFMLDGCSVPTYTCEGDRIVLMCSHEHLSNINGQWREYVKGENKGFWKNEDDGGWE